MRSTGPSSSKTRISNPRPVHVVLEHRESEHLRSYLQFLRNKGHHQNNLPTKLCVYSDFEWLKNGIIIAESQRQELFETLSEICGHLRHLHIDLLCDAASSPETEAINQGPMDRSVQVLPCSLVTRLLKNAPVLETLRLKELVLEGDPEQLHELILCLKKHPTLRQVDLRWKFNGSRPDSDSVRILDPLILGLARTPNLRQLNLMIPHWCPALLQIPRSQTLTKVQLTVEEPTPMMQLLQDWKDNTVLRHLELSSFQVLQDCSGLLELMKHSRSLQRLVVIDHNIFQPRTNTSQHLISNELPQSIGTRNDDKLASRNNSCFVQALVNALRTNTSLEHLQLISATSRLPSDLRSQRDRHHRQLLGEMMEYNYVLEHLEISHAGVHISAPRRQPQNHSGRHLFLDHIDVSAGKSTAFDNPCDDKLDFYLRLNQGGYRRQLLTKGDNNAATNQEGWYQAVQHYQNDTASLFSLIQGAPLAVIACIP